MATPATKPAPLVPRLTDHSDKRTKHDATALRPGDQLILKAPILGFPRNSKLPVYGCCVLSDTAGQVYQVLAYVRGGEFAVSYPEREFKKPRTGTKKEQWFGAFAMYLTEICLTDYEDVLRLERLSPELSALLCPEVEEAQAGAIELRKAA